MAATPRQLCQFVATTGEVTYYGPVPAATRVIVTNIVIANVTTGPVAFSLSAVPASGTAGNANRIVPAVSFVGNSMQSIDLALVLEVGGFLSALAAAGSAITVTISGVVVI